MRKAVIGLGLVGVLGLGIGFGANEMTNAQDITATPGQLLICGTPLATPEGGASPEASATPGIVMNSTPMAGAGPVIASPGAVSSDTCETEPS
jgi:hypothetical protein